MAKAVVCKFDPEEGFALNDAARAYCVALWTGDDASDALDTQETATVRVDFDVIRQATKNFDDAAQPFILYMQGRQVRQCSPQAR